MRQLLAMVALLVACGGGKGSDGTDNTGSGGSAVVVRPMIDPKTQPIGLDLSLSNGKQGAPAFDRTKLAPAQPLSDADVQAMLARGKAIAVATTDVTDFAFRPASQPPPKTGQVVTAAFPPSPSALLPPEVKAPKLTVSRYAPEGDVPIAPQLTVTFSQPMIAVTSQDAAAANVPVKLAPQPKGQWRWIGTRTIVFDPDVRFPQATTYTVEVPAGTKSVTGQATEAATKFTFTTPPPQVVASTPNNYATQRLDVPMFLEFDQLIDAQTAIGKIQVTADDKPVAIALLTDNEIAKNVELARIVEDTKKERDGRWIAFRSTNPLPTSAKIVIKVLAGFGSKEGPNTVAATKDVSNFETYKPLVFEKTECAGRYDPEPCRPEMAITVWLNNELDAPMFDPKAVTITPPIADVDIFASGRAIVISGATMPRTTYKIAVASGVLDVFGQKLDKPIETGMTIGEARPRVFGPQSTIALEPTAKPSLAYFTTNLAQLKTKIYAVTASDYAAYENWLNKRWDLESRQPPIPGKKVFDKAVDIAKSPDLLVETAIDLAPALTAGLGHAIIVVEPSPWDVKAQGKAPELVAWVQATKLSISSQADNDHVIAFVTELGTGKPLAGVDVQLVGGATAKTDDKGVASLPFDTRHTTYLLAKRGADVAITQPGDRYGRARESSDLLWYIADDRQMYKPGEQVTLAGLLRVNDNNKGGDLRALEGFTSSVRWTVFDSEENKIASGTSNVGAKGTFETKFTLPKTPNLGYTRIQFAATQRDGELSEEEHGIQIEEFRTPEFEVSAHASEAPFVAGGGGDITVDAKYYSGGPLAGAATTWRVNASETTFTPPNRSEYTFGRWIPWWGRGYANYDDTDPDDKTPRAPTNWTHASKTDGGGSHVLHLDIKSVKPTVPMSVTASASVMDVNRQEWTASTSIVVHPASRYVGVKPANKPFVEQGTPFELDIVGVDLEGKTATGAKITVVASRLEIKREKNVEKTVEVDPETCAVTVADKDHERCKFAAKTGGTYRVLATITDDAGHTNTTKYTFWVTGQQTEPVFVGRRGAVSFVPDKKEYSPGNTAELLVTSPLYPAEAVVTWRRSGIVEMQRIAFEGPTKVITVPITDALVPNVAVSIDVVGMTAALDPKGNPDPTKPKKSAYATGSIDLAVSLKQRALAVTVAPGMAKVSPGDKATFSIDVKEADGKPAADATVMVFVVDEAILALANHEFDDPIGSFYPHRYPGVSENHLIDILRDPSDWKPSRNSGWGGYDDYAPAEFKAGYSRRAYGGGGMGYGTIGHGAGTGEGYGVGGGRGGMRGRDAEEMDDRKVVAKEKAPDKAEPAKPTVQPNGNQPTTGAKGPAPVAIAVRSNFNPLALFAGAVATDVNGHATLEATMPDNVTRYRIVAIAATAMHFGKGESNVTARLPMIVRPSAPRFLNFGDKFQLPIVVQNQTDAPITAKIAVRASNLTLEGATENRIGRSVVVPPNDRVEVQLPAAAASAGTARFQVVATSMANGKEVSDASEIELPVWTPATSEAFATYGVIDDGAISQPVALPGAVVAQFGGLEVSTASTNLQALTDALLYIVHYKFDCAEQRSSRIMSIAALRDVLVAFQTRDMPSQAAMADSMVKDMIALSKMQAPSGAFGFWEPDEDDGYPYLTIYVTNALLHAKQKGYAVPREMLERALGYLTAIDEHIADWYHGEWRRSIQAYALATRRLANQIDIKKAKEIIDDAGGVDKLEIETAGWILAAIAGQPGAATERAAILKHALNKVSETAGAANFTTSYGDGAHLLLASDERVDAVMLDALIAEQPANDLIPKIVTGLMAARKAGRWLSTQENSFVLLALDRYFRTYEKTTPNFVARVWLGNDYAGDHAFRGRSTVDYKIPMPMTTVAAHDKSNLVIQKDGAGRLYYRIGMTYAPASLSLDAVDRGFIVERKYEAVDDPKDVTRDAQGVWHVKAGTRVRVRLSMVNENRRYHVALVDPLPAGLEVMNPALATTGPVPQDPAQKATRGRYWYYDSTWYDHQNMRDERVEAFTQDLDEGVHPYTYVARATTPGTYVVPPPKAEEMYMPETFGRGATDRVVVE